MRHGQALDTYLYPADIELYYLQSRYYSADIGRFINADSTDYLGVSGTVLSYNLFSYCENNHIMHTDITGAFSSNSVISLFKTVLNYFKESAISYFRSLISFGEGTLNISTNIISRIINIVIKSVVPSQTIKLASFLLGKIATSYLIRNRTVLVNIIQKISTVIQGNIGKTILKLIIKNVIGKIFRLKDSLISNIATDMINNFIKSKSQVLSRVFTVVSAFGSVGGVLALLLFDMTDRNIDGYFSVRINHRHWKVILL